MLANGSIDTRANNARMPRNNTAGLRVCITSSTTPYTILVRYSRNYGKWHRNGPTGSINDKLGETGSVPCYQRGDARNHEKQVAISGSLVN